MLVVSRVLNSKDIQKDIAEAIKSRQYLSHANYK